MTLKLTTNDFHNNFTMNAITTCLQLYFFFWKTERITICNSRVDRINFVVFSWHRISF